MVGFEPRALSNGGAARPSLTLPKRHNFPGTDSLKLVSRASAATRTTRWPVVSLLWTRSMTPEVQ
jgi:hypothetical protein